MKHFIIIVLGFWGLAGMCDGVAETLQFHYTAFEAKCPTCQSQYWNPEISWINKYAASETLRERYIGSTTIFVWATDAYHLYRSMTTWCLVLGWLVCCMIYMRLHIELGW